MESTPTIGKQQPPAALTILGVVLVLIGGAAFAGLLATGHEQRAWSSFLQGLVLPTWIAIGALFFIAIHRVCGAVWTTPLRRLIEGLTAPLTLTAVGFVAIAAAGAPYLYDWVHAKGVEHSALFHQHGHASGITKSQWMQPTRWMATTGIILALWVILRHRLITLSRRQDAGVDIAAPHLHVSVAMLLVLAPTFTLFVWDLLLSLHVTFASTMWGVYCFTGAVQTFLAVLVLAVVVLRRGALGQLIKDHTLHDLGTWTLAWGVFCGYIGFAQYLVIYFANLDEEVAWFLPRLQNGYGAAYAAEAGLRVFLPFALLMSQGLRTRPAALAIAAVAILLGNWMDWSWIIAPAFSPNDYRPFWAWPEVAVGCGFAGASLLAALRFWRRNGYVALQDPHLVDAVHGTHLH